MKSTCVVRGKEMPLNFNILLVISIIPLEKLMFHLKQISKFKQRIMI